MLAVIKSCGNNLNSIQFALQRLGVDFTVTDDPAIIKSASKIILPGVGSADIAMQKLRDNKLIEVIKNCTQPLLGICLGMQLLYEYSEEKNTECLKIIPGAVSKINREDTDMTIPHMGWNAVDFINDSILNRNIPDNYYYFVHSFTAPINSYTAAFTHYGAPFTAIVQYKNFIGMQFHPERSGKNGEILLMNFLNGDFS